MSDVKESLELVSSIELVGVNVKKAFADGKLNGDDLQYAMAIIKDVKVLVDGIEGLSHLKEEVQDIDEQEALQLGLALFKAFKNIKAA